MALWIVLWACGDEAAPVSSPLDPSPATPTAADLTERLSPGEARAGFVTDEAALFAGVSAEGRVGDVKIYNDRVQFVIQGLRDSSYYLSEGGTVIDADVVRPEGAFGRDLVDEWAPMVGVGRVMRPENIEIVADGSDGGPAIVRVSGVETALGLFEGALESPGIVVDYGLEMETVYTLPPDQWLMEVATTVRSPARAVSVGVADLLLGAPEAGRWFTDGFGAANAGGAERRWTGYVGDRNDVAVATLAAPGQPLDGKGYDLVTALAEMAVAGSPPVDVPEGGSVTFTRYYGVGPDLATLSDAAHLAWGDATRRVTGVVEAADGPVAGARVTVLVDGDPHTVAFTDDEGAFAVDVPTTGAVETRASGRSTGRFVDLAPGAPSYAPYAAGSVRAQALAGLTEGAPAPAVAEGRGVADPSDPLRLGEPARLWIVADDAGPFAARLGFAAGDPVAIDDRWVHERPGGLAAAGWARAGELYLEVEPGDYQLVVHRGIRYELHDMALTLAPGEERVVDVSLPAAYRHDGWLLADPHSHASPSADGAITMEDRLLVTAAVGVQVHFGTDHDHLADYRPLVDALGVGAHVRSVVADEVSPPLRGHMNIYPVEPADLPNGGSFRWWVDVPETTEGLVDTLRELHGDTFVLQSNHPTDSGVAAAARWSPGVIGEPDRWTDRFEAMEVLNASDTGDYPDVWWDLVLRGQAVTPVGVSDSHSHFGGSVGMSATWMHTGGDLDTLTDEQVAAAFRSGAVVVTRGPFLDVDPLPQTVAAGTTLRVDARSPTWIGVDRLRLLRDGVEVAVVDGTSAAFTLTTDEDAVFVVVAEGDRPMWPVLGDTPWAMTGAYRVDADGDGFEAPLPPLARE